MEPQGRGNVPALHTPERNKRLAEQDHSRIESARSNSWAECRTKYRHRAEEEVFLLTFPFIGLYRLRRSGLNLEREFYDNLEAIVLRHKQRLRQGAKENFEGAFLGSSRVDDESGPNSSYHQDGGTRIATSCLTGTRSSSSVTRRSRAKVCCFNHLLFLNALLKRKTSCSCFSKIA